MNNSPRGLALDPDGNLWVQSTSSKDGQVQKFTPDGKIEPFVKGHPFHLPHNIVRVADGRFFVTDNYEHCVWKVTANGEKEKWVSDEPMDRPVGLCRNGANLLIADPHIRTSFSLAPDKKLTVLVKSSVPQKVNVVKSLPLCATGSASGCLLSERQRTHWRSQWHTNATHNVITSTA